MKPFLPMNIRGTIVFFTFLSALLSMTSVFADGEPLELSIRLNGLPSGARKNKVFLKAIRVEDGVMAASVRQNAWQDHSLEAEDTHLLVTASYFSRSPATFLEAATGFYGQEVLQLSMQNQKRSSGNNKNDFPLTPPQHGIAIGYNSEDFIVTGADDMPWLNRGMRDIVITDMGLDGSQCNPGNDHSFVIVATADPQHRAHLEDEINLQQRPDFDEKYRVKPRWIKPTHMLHGRITITEGSVIATVYLIDLATGEVIASATKTGKGDQLLETVGALGEALARETCKEKPWNGTIQIEDHASETFQNSDPNKPGGTSKSDLSISCNVKGPDTVCSVAYSSLLTGNGATLERQANGSTRVNASAGPSGGNKFSVYVGRFDVVGTVKVSMEGLNDSGPETMTFGGIGADGPMLDPKARTHSGTYQEGTRTISWNFSK